MACVIYIATRNLIVGHEFGNEYSIDFDVSKAEPKDEAEIKETISMGGNPSSILTRIDREWSVETVPVLYSDLDTWREWFHSVANKEIFTLDVSGSFAVPGDPREGYIKDKGLQYSRINANYMRINFNFVEFE